MKIRNFIKKLRAKLSENKKIRVLAIIGWLLLCINLLINFLRELNHKEHFFVVKPYLKILYHTVNHPLFIFFEHSWIEIASAILVYLLLEDKFKHVDRIPEQVNERNHEDILNKFATEAKEIIRILDTSIHSFTENYELFNRSMEAALKKNTKIEILLLHPDTYAAEQRSKDLTLTTRTFLENMKLGLYRLHEFINTLPPEKAKRITVKLFKTTPMLILASWDDKANFGLLHPNNLADKMDTFLVDVNTPLVRSFNRYFSDLWSEANYRSNRTVLLKDYLFVKIIHESTVIDGLNWGGDNESCEIPKYIVDTNNQVHYESLKKLCGENILVKIGHDNNYRYGYLKLLDNELDSYKTKYATSQIKKTYGNKLIFNNFIFQIQYSYDTQIMLKDKKVVKDKLDLKGYTFISHNQYDVILSPLVKDTMIALKNVFEKDLQVDKYDQKAITLLTDRTGKRMMNPRKRLLAEYTCKIHHGQIYISATKSNVYPFPFEIADKNETVYSVKSRRFTTLQELLDDAKAREDKHEYRHFETINTFLKSTIRADILYLLGETGFTNIHREFKVHVHLIRTWVSKGPDACIKSSPNPQRDRTTQCDYQVIHLVSRENIIGGINEILVGLNSRNSIKDSLLLENPLDSLFFKKEVRVKNKIVYTEHFTGDIQLDPKPKKTKDGFDVNSGHRDVIVIEFVEKNPFGGRPGNVVKNIIKKVEVFIKSASWTNIV